MQNLDADLAQALTDYIAFLLIYQRYPKHGKIDPKVILDRQLAMLEEIGFIKEGMYNFFHFSEFDLELGSPGRMGLRLPHNTYTLTHRGYELCNAIFSGDKPFETSLRGKLPTDEQQIDMFVKLVEAALDEDTRPILLHFGSQDPKKWATVTIPKDVSSENSMDCSAILSALAGFGVTPSAISVSVLNRLSEKGCFSTVGPRTEKLAT